VYLSPLATNIASLAADNRVKDALRNALPSKKILFRLGPLPLAGKSSDYYHKEVIENGALVVIVAPDYVWYGDLNRWPAHFSCLNQSFPFLRFVSLASH
jgi:hypothetical protein